MMFAQAPYTVISRAVQIHPTVSEFVPTVLQSLRPQEWDGNRLTRDARKKERKKYGQPGARARFQFSKR